MKTKANRIHKSETARKKRKEIKDIVFMRTINFFSKMRKKRRNK
jgi:hypothetical protein